MVNADVAIVLSSLVDHRHETAWADRLRQATGARVGFVGLAASKLPQLFRSAATSWLWASPSRRFRTAGRGENVDR
jgi:hypothetical protein